MLYTGPNNCDVESSRNNIRCMTGLKALAGNTYPSYFISRPTNTSVLYCIKYEPTYFIKFEGKDKYSTEESIIGEWIDGKPIYRKIIQTDNKTPAVNVELNIAIDVNNIREVVNYYGMCTLDGRYQRLPYNTASNTNIQMVVTDINPCNILLKVSATGSVGMNISYLAIEYTKTTD